MCERAYVRVRDAASSWRPGAHWQASEIHRCTEPLDGDTQKEKWREPCGAKRRGKTYSPPPHTSPPPAFEFARSMCFMWCGAWRAIWRLNNRKQPTSRTNPSAPASPLPPPPQWICAFFSRRINELKLIGTFPSVSPVSSLCFAARL